MGTVSLATVTINHIALYFEEPNCMYAKLSQKIWIQLFPLSETKMNPSLSIATPSGDCSCPSAVPLLTIDLRNWPWVVKMEIRLLQLHVSHTHCVVSIIAIAMLNSVVHHHCHIILRRNLPSGVKTWMR